MPNITDAVIDRKCNSIQQFIWLDTLGDGIFGDFSDSGHLPGQWCGEIEGGYKVILSTLWSELQISGIYCKEYPNACWKAGKKKL